MILKLLKKLIRSIDKSVILSIVIVFILIIIGLAIQVIFLFRDINSGNNDISNNKSIHNHHHHNININEGEIINSEDVRGRSKTLLRHRIDEKRKGLKLTNDSSVITDSISSSTKPKKSNHNSIIIKKNISNRPKHRNDHDHYQYNDTNVITWYINSIIRIIISVFRFLYSILTVFSLKTPITSSRDYEDLVINNSNDGEVPHIVQLFRQAKLDWHTLVPAHDSSYERYYHDKNDSHSSFHLKVLKETRITDYLTQFHESGLSALYGHNHGKLATYSSCDILSSGCNIHDEVVCDKNQLCFWDKDNEICNEVDGNKRIDNMCSYPKNLSSNGTIINVNHTQCSSYSNQKTVVVTIEQEAQLMFYHWWAIFTDLFYSWHTKFLDDRNIHFYIKDVEDPMFFSYFGLISDYCWRRVKSQVPKGVCFCDIEEIKPRQSRIEFTNVADYITNYLNLQDVSPPKDKTKIGIVSRRRKRFILNEYKLTSICLDMGYECVLIPLESMTIFEQVKILKSLDVLIGVHGSALDNVGFLSEGSVLVQLIPYKVKHRATFKGTAMKAHVKYMEWKATDQKLSVFHWDNLQESNPGKLEEYTRDEILEAGQDNASRRETLMFWINQDIIVPEDEWKDLLKKAVNQSRHENK